MKFTPTEIKDKLGRTVILRNAEISDNKSAIALYRKLGFEKNGSFPKNMKYADGTYADADWMMKKL